MLKVDTFDSLETEIEIHGMAVLNPPSLTNARD